MLHKQTITPFLENTLKQLMLIGEFKSYRLVGGTALSLLLGHRMSDDIDFFSSEYTRSDLIYDIAKKYFPHAEINNIGFGVSLYLPIPETNRQLKVDIMSNDEFITDPYIEEGIRIARFEDLAAMKLDVISVRLRKKDFWDIAELLNIFIFKQMLGFYLKRFYWNDPQTVLSRITKFDECEQDPDPICLDGKSWETVKKEIIYSFNKFVEEDLEKAKILLKNRAKDA